MSISYMVAPLPGYISYTIYTIIIIVITIAYAEFSAIFFELVCVNDVCSSYITCHIHNGGDDLLANRENE